MVSLLPSRINCSVQLIAFLLLLLSVTSTSPIHHTPTSAMQDTWTGIANQNCIEMNQAKVEIFNNCTVEVILCPDDHIGFAKIYQLPVREQIIMVEIQIPPSCSLKNNDAVEVDPKICSSQKIKVICSQDKILKLTQDPRHDDQRISQIFAFVLLIVSGLIFIAEVVMIVKYIRSSRQTTQEKQRQTLHQVLSRHSANSDVQD